ncbi:MAG: Gfo/Idh/MocA family oxidoreductase [Caldilineaceae bacterium]
MVNLHWYWTRPPVRWMWNRALAGGQIVDQNIHLVDLSQALAGDVDTVYACYNERQSNFDDGFDNWDAYALTLRYKSGAVGNCTGTYALYPEIQDPATADFALRDRLLRITEAGLDVMTPSGVEHTPSRGAFRAGVNRAFIRSRAYRRSHSLRAGLWEGIRLPPSSWPPITQRGQDCPSRLTRFLSSRRGLRDRDWGLGIGDWDLVE